MWLFPFSFCSLQLRVIFKLLEIAPSFRICIISPRLRETCCCGITLTTPPPPRSESRWHSGCCFMGSGSCWQQAAPWSAVSGVSSRPAGSALDSGLSVAPFSRQAGTHARSDPPCCSLNQVSRSQVLHRHAVFRAASRWSCFARYHWWYFWQKIPKSYKRKMIFSNPLLALDYLFFQWQLCNGQLELKIKQVFFCNLLQLINQLQTHKHLLREKF